ncbi:MAG: hypothetical protein L3J69_06280 [Desulfobacula sp.]|nr:hypothetical protein [Desulfobacula sp.]
MDTNNKMPSKKKTTYSIQVVVIMAVFCFVLFNLVFRLILDMRLEEEKKRVDHIEKEKIKQEFVAGIDKKYDRILKLYNAKEYEKAIEIIKLFNKYDKSDHKDLPKIKKGIRMYYLKKKLEFIPKIQLNEYMALSKDIRIEDDNSTEVFIRTPRYGQYFYTSDFPLQLEASALSVTGDFSDGIVWKSSIDGELGRGKKINVSLSIGEHKITAMGTNGVTQGFMTTRVFIEKDPEFLKKYRKD